MGVAMCRSYSSSKHKPKWAYHLHLYDMECFCVQKHVKFWMFCFICYVRVRSDRQSFIYVNLKLYMCEDFSWQTDRMTDSFVSEKCLIPSVCGSCSSMSLIDNNITIFGSSEVKSWSLSTITIAFPYPTFQSGPRRSRLVRYYQNVQINIIHMKLSLIVDHSGHNLH